MQMSVKSFTLRETHNSTAYDTQPVNRSTVHVHINVVYTVLFIFLTSYYSLSFCRA